MVRRGPSGDNAAATEMSEALEPLIQDGVLEAVLGQLKSGKEAEVWLVQHAGEVVAAKVYKERHQRNFANNAGYREGRDVRNSRTRRAMAKGTKFGQAAAEEAWRSAEADSLFKLHALGVRVPTPVMFYEGILLMELVIDPAGHPAPRLIEAPPQSAEEARAMYLDLRAQIVAMLCADLIHGDLSPYNILMAWNGPTIIDFPQTIAAARNNNAERYFKRDLDNVLNFFAGIDPSLRAMHGDSREIWNAYLRRDLTPDFVPSQQSSQPPQRARPPQQGARQQGPRGSQPQRVDVVGAVQSAAQHVPAPTASSEVDAAEAELRALEALVLRQGGGARSKPPGAGADKNAPPQGRGRGPRRGPPNGPGRPQNAQARAPSAGPRTPNAGSQTSNAGPRTPNAGPRTSNAGSQASNAGPRTSNADRRTSNGGPRTPNADRRTSNAALQTPNAGPRTSNAGPRTANAGPRTANAGPGTSNAGPGTSNADGRTSNAGPRATDSQQARSSHTHGQRRPHGGGRGGERGHVGQPQQEARAPKRQPSSGPQVSYIPRPPNR